MERLSKHAADFVRQLAEVIYRLASNDIVVTTLHADWSQFGCWQLCAERGAESERYAEGLRSSDPLRAVGAEVIRVFWDGRDGVLTVEASPTRFCSSPNEWKEECVKGFSNSGEDALRFAEDYLIKRLGT